MRIDRLSLLLLGLLTPVPAAAGEPPRTGYAIEEFELRDLRGEAHALSRWKDRRLVVVANRLPLTLKRTGDGWAAEPSVGGLATALRPLLERSEGLWIGWSGESPEPGDARRWLLQDWCTRYANAQEGCALSNLSHERIHASSVYQSRLECRKQKTTRQVMPAIRVPSSAAAERWRRRTRN